ncbi:hypothetical protein SLS58_002665 [Diplodia intermedia]|uniref:Uncharacterized protein n=1 Tax=Diplodia intermedia TaxID=856260 RepID=A0ABR3TY48_9PEZI
MFSRKANSAPPASASKQNVQRSNYFALVMRDDPPNGASARANRPKKPRKREATREGFEKPNEKLKKRKKASGETTRPHAVNKSLKPLQKEEDKSTPEADVESGPRYEAEEQRTGSPDSDSPEPDRRIPPDIMERLNEEEQAAAILMSMGMLGFRPECLPPNRRECLLREHKANVDGEETDVDDGQSN